MPLASSTVKHSPGLDGGSSSDAVDAGDAMVRATVARFEYFAASDFHDRTLGTSLRWSSLAFLALVAHQKYTEKIQATRLR
jgi:hypothetical protein